MDCYPSGHCSTLNSKEGTRPETIEIMLHLQISILNPKHTYIHTNKTCVYICTPKYLTRVCQNRNFVTTVFLVLIYIMVHQLHCRSVHIEITPLLRCYYPRSKELHSAKNECQSVAGKSS